MSELDEILDHLVIGERLNGDGDVLERTFEIWKDGNITNANQASEELDDILQNLSWAQHKLGTKGLIPLSKHEYEAKAKIESIICTEKLKLLAEVRERVQVNQKGQFEQDGTGTVCWYLDDLVEALKELEAEL